MYTAKFLQYLTYEKRSSPHTITAYALEMKVFEAFLDEAQVAFDQVDFRVIRQYLSTMRESGRQASSINRSISALRSYYRFLQREKLVHENPMPLVHALKTPKKLPVVVEEAKLIQLLDAQQMQEEESSFETTRDFLVLELLFGTGIRLTELLRIQEKDIDLYNKKILILGKRNKERFIPIHATLIEAIKSYLTLKYEQEFENKSNHLIVTNVGRSAYAKLIYRIVQKYLSQITTQKKRSPHVLRHSFATALLNNGADLNAIKELLGHAGLAATQVYTHNSVERLKSIYKQAHPKAE